MEEKITIVMGDREPTRQTGEAGESGSVVCLGRQTVVARVQKQAQSKLLRKD